jgi:hypothetical protein
MYRKFSSKHEDAMIGSEWDTFSTFMDYILKVSVMTFKGYIEIDSAKEHLAYL